jgi:hypothetical protein
MQDSMKRTVLTSVAVILLVGLSSAQSQLQNPGFELWEDILIGSSDTIREPVDWSSLKTSDVESMSNYAPVVCKRSSNAHSGNYSIKLTSVNSLIVANGVASNGRVHPDLNTSLAYIYTDEQDGKWNTPFNAKPDSVVGWFRYLPQTKDTLGVKVILHRGYGKQPDADYLDNWIGMAAFYSPLNTGSQWVRFSAPFVYFDDTTPQYILIVLNSGNGFHPVAGSIAYFDDIEMIYHSPQTNTDNPVVSAAFMYVVDNHFLVIRGMQQDQYTSVSIRDISGDLIWNGNVTDDRIDISPAHLEKGLYLFSLIGKSAFYSQKIMVH